MNATTERKKRGLCAYILRTNMFCNRTSICYSKTNCNLWTYL